MPQQDKFIVNGLSKTYSEVYKQNLNDLIPSSNFGNPGPSGTVNYQVVTIAISLFPFFFLFFCFFFFFIKTMSFDEKLIKQFNTGLILLLLTQLRHQTIFDI